jgi:two-component system sensor histidine kinase DegS
MPRNNEPSPVEELIAATQEELDRSQREMRETSRMVEQSRGEVDRMAQRNAQITAQVRQLAANLESVPRTDIKAAYDAAQDSQQRLFTMRGQLEKLQGEQASLERMTEYLQNALQALETARTAGPADGGMSTIIRIIEAQEGERQRLSKQLHDGPAQAFSNFILQTDIAVRLFDIDAERAKTELAGVRTAAMTTLQKVRDLIFDLRPMMLDDLGLIPTVKRYVDSLKEKSGLQITLQITGADQQRLESVREVMVFRGIQELLGNIRDHAQATQVRITLDVDGNRVRVTVEDNGKGFDAQNVVGGAQRTIGLNALKERVDLLGGSLEIDSQLGQGTRVMMEIPSGQMTSGPLGLR